MADPTAVTLFFSVMGGAIGAFAGLRLAAARALPQTANDISEADKQRLRDKFRPYAKSLLPEDLAQLNKKDLLTGNEREFYGRLTRALPEYVVLAQVSMGALIDVNQALASEEFAVRDKFSRKIVDYVVCSKALEVIALIELDDQMHDAEKDRLRDAMTAAAGYQTLRWDSRSKPSEAAIRDQVLALGR